MGEDRGSTRGEDDNRHSCLKVGGGEDRGSTTGEDSDEDRGRATEDDATTTGTRAEVRAGEDRR